MEKREQKERIKKQILYIAVSVWLITSVILGAINLDYGIIWFIGCPLLVVCIVLFVLFFVPPIPR